MRTLHVYSGNLYGGIEAILLTLATFRGEAGDHEFALCFDGRLSHDLEAAGAAVANLGEVRLSRPQTLRRARLRLREALAPGRFDRVVCHAPWTQGLFGGVVRRAGLPLAFWAHDAMTGGHWTERLARRLPPDIVICNSEFTASTLPLLYSGVASCVVHPPVPELPPLTEDARARLRASLATDESAVVVITACRSEAWKGHEVLVEALAALGDLPGWTWWQVGGAQRPDEEAWLRSIREKAQSRGIADRTRWLGQRADVPQLLRAADIYCQPNLSPEPFGVVFVEALRAGLPVVTSALGGALEIVNETCGVLTAAGDARAVAAALRPLIEDRTARARQAAGGPARAAAVSDPVTQFRKLEQALAHMLPAVVRA